MSRPLIWIYPLLTLPLTLPARCQQDNQTLTFANLTSGATIVQANKTISTTSGDSFTVGGSANVTFQAGTSITLWPGFTANALNGGATFKAYIAPIVDYTISGTVTNASGGALAGATVTLSGSMGGSTTTGSNGTYSLPVAPGQAYSYTATPTMAGQTFSPASMGPYINVTTNISGVTFRENSTILTTVTDFINCVKSTGSGASCILAGGPYTIDSTTGPIVVGRNVVVGGSTDPGNPTLLIRGQYYTGAMMRVGRDVNYNPVPLTNVTIQSLTFCGGLHRYDNGNPAHPDGDPQNPCPITLPNGTTCDSLISTGGFCDSDFVVLGTGPAQAWASGPGAPFNNMGPYNVTVANCRFEDVTGGLLIAPYAVGEVINDVYLHDNTISSGGAQIGAFGASTSTNWADYTQCDNWTSVPGHVAFAEDTTVPFPRNIRFDHNTFWINAGGVSGLGRYVQVTNNPINGYYWSTGGGGGAIEQESCADQVKIAGNTLCGDWDTNPNSQTYNTCIGWQSGATGPSGMELYSRNLTVSSNTVSGYAVEGIGVLSTYSANISSNHLYDNNRSALDPEDIKVATRYPWPVPCNPGTSCPAYRDTLGLAVQNNDSVGQPANYTNHVQYGVYLVDGGEGSTNNVNICGIQMIQGLMCGISGNAGLAYTVADTAMDQRVTADTSNIRPAATVLADSNPDTIATFPEGTPPLGVPTGYFLFGATDPLGLSDMNGYSYGCNPVTNQCGYIWGSIQGLFDPQADPINLGRYGPYTTSTACSFLYIPAYNVVYLDDTAGDGKYNAGSSLVGNGGQTIGNSVCSINGANSTLTPSQPTAGQHYIEINLDITFHQTGTYYIYEVAVNNSVLYSTSNQGFSGLNPPPPDTGPSADYGRWSLWGYWPVTIAQ